MFAYNSCHFFKWNCIFHNYSVLLCVKKTWHINIETCLAKPMRKTCQWFVSNAERMSISVNFFQHFAWNLCNIALWGPAKHPQSTFACALLIARNGRSKVYKCVTFGPKTTASSRTHKTLFNKTLTHKVSILCNVYILPFHDLSRHQKNRFLTVGNLTGKILDLISTLAVTHCSMPWGRNQPTGFCGPKKPWAHLVLKEANDAIAESNWRQLTSKWWSAW